MRSVHVIAGPPGCGKTSKLLSYAEGAVEAGVPWAGIAVLTFTVAAKDEVLDRIGERHGLTAKDVPYVRTIHAAALERLREDGVAILTDDDWQEFADRYAYELSSISAGDDDEGDLVVPPTRTPDDLARYVYDWGRNRRLEPMEALGRCPVQKVGIMPYLRFARRLEEFKFEKKRVDFADVLLLTRESGRQLPVAVGLVDEAQDLSRLQVEVVERFFARCDRVYVAGDDDQAVYEFQGGCAEWFLDLAEKHPTEILSQSYRLPRVVKALADRIIQRNHSRLAKPFAAAERDGSIECSTERLVLEGLDSSTDTLVLARNRTYLRPYAQGLVDRIIPFLVQGRGGLNPLGDHGLVTAFSVARGLCEGVAVTPAAKLHVLLSYVPRSNPFVTDAIRKDVERATKDGFIFRDEGLFDGLGLAAFIADLRARGIAACLRSFPAWKVRYLEALWRVHGEIPKPKIILTSIHGAKGREADLVVVIPDMTPATAKSYASRRRGTSEAENRIFYVAVTRTRSRLVLVAPRTRNHYTFPRLATEVTHA